MALSKGVLARYNITRVDLKTFTIFVQSKSLSIDNAVLGPIPKRLLFNMIKNVNGLTGLQPVQISALRFKLILAVCKRETCT